MQRSILFLLLITALERVSSYGTRTKRMYGLCPPTFFRIGSACYYISSKKLNWLDAHFECRDRNSKLAEPAKTTDRQLRRYLLASDKYPDSIWIGGTYEWNLHKWVWGYSGNDIKYQSFSRMDTRNSHDLLYHCAVLNPELKYRWSASPCVDGNRYICQHKMPKVSAKNREKVYVRWNQTFPNQMANEILLEVTDNGQFPRNHQRRNFEKPIAINHNEKNKNIQVNSIGDYAKQNQKPNSRTVNEPILRKTDFDKIAERKRQKEIKRRKRIQQRRKQKKVVPNMMKPTTESRYINQPERTPLPWNEATIVHQKRKHSPGISAHAHPDRSTQVDSDETNHVAPVPSKPSIIIATSTEKYTGKSFDLKEKNMVEINEVSKNTKSKSNDIEQPNVTFPSTAKVLSTKTVTAASSETANNLSTTITPTAIASTTISLTTIASTPIAPTTSASNVTPSASMKLPLALLQQSVAKQAARMEALWKYREKKRKLKEERLVKVALSINETPAESEDNDDKEAKFTELETQQITDEEKRMRLRKLRERIEKLTPEQRKKFHELRMQRKKQKIKRSHQTNLSSHSNSNENMNQ